MSTIESTMKQMELSLRTDMAKIDGRIAEWKAEVIRWMFLFWIGQFGVTIAAIKLLK